MDKINQIHECVIHVQVKLQHLTVTLDIPVFVHYRLANKKAKVEKAFAALPEHSHFDPFWNLSSFESDLNFKIRGKIR